MTPTPPALIETMRLAHGRIALWPGHQARLQASAAALGYPLDPVALNAQVSAAIRASATAALAQDGRPSEPSPVWRIRLLLAADGALSLETTPLPDTPTPVRLALAQERLDEAPSATDASIWRRHKTTRRPWFSAAQDWLLAHPDYFDLVFGDAAGALCEGSRCNLYVRDAQGCWLTPPADGTILPGVQRQWLLDQSLVREAALSLVDLRHAPALRVSNALRGWLDAQLDAA
ncbi:aminotransferase class IV [Castellaniella sp.]|uniref:aminotransferase class IV n=1 Tax=Castellaniella sp. TaxID=1955812 RepID=UPI002AFEDA91|nr:aminotransferase class IV [Castellaniella sp.]